MNFFEEENWREEEELVAGVRVAGAVAVAMGIHHPHQLVEEVAFRLSPHQ